MGKEQTDSPKALKRVTQACARCKMKKVKAHFYTIKPQYTQDNGKQLTYRTQCCGSTPCTRCKADDSVCYYGVRGGNDKGMVSKTHVDRLLWQQKHLIKALRVLWHDKTKDADTTEEPSVHAIVASTGVLEDVQNAQSVFQQWVTDFEEDSVLSPTSSSAADQQSSTDAFRRGSMADFDWAAEMASNSHLPVTDLDAIFDFVPDQTSNQVPEFSMPDLSALPIADTAMTGISEPETLARRRGAKWLPKVQMPGSGGAVVPGGMDSLIVTTPRAEVP